MKWHTDDVEWRTDELPEEIQENLKKLKKRSSFVICIFAFPLLVFGIIEFLAAFMILFLIAYILRAALSGGIDNDTFTNAKWRIDTVEKAYYHHHGTYLRTVSGLVCEPQGTPIPKAGDRVLLIHYKSIRPYAYAEGGIWNENMIY